MKRYRAQHTAIDPQAPVTARASRSRGDTKTTREQQIAELQLIARATAEEARIAELQRLARENERAEEAPRAA